MKTVLEILFPVLGGLGIFLLGMKHLSEGLQAAAGQSLRKIMSFATTKRVAGVGTGIISTILVQSSSIITVMLVGFVSASIMTLEQSFNVLIGANIGTTATVWIIQYAPSPLMLGLGGLALGGIFYFFLRGEKIHHIGLSLVGIGLVFLGLYFMSQGVQPIRNNESLTHVFTKMSAENMFGVFEIALVATLLTAVIQSSAATIAIAIALQANGLISHEVAIAVLFGANIGTTATGWIAAIGGSAAARRTALAHTLSNVFGSLVFIWAFDLFAMIPNLAIADTVFALCRGALFFPLTKPFCALIERLIKQPEDEKPHLSTLKMGAKISPVLACDQALTEIDFMKKSDLELLDCARKVISGETENDSGPEKHLVHREDILDRVQREVTEFLGAIMSKRLAIDVSERARRLLRLTDELESVSDECAKVYKVVKRLRDEKQRMSAKSVALLLDIHDKVAEFALKVTPLICSPRVPFELAALQKESTNIHEYIRAARRIQLGRIGPEDPGSSIRVLGELDIINAYERIRAYYLNCAETLAGGKR